MTMERQPKTFAEKEVALWEASRRYLQGEISAEELEAIERPYHECPYHERFRQAVLHLATREVFPSIWHSFLHFLFKIRGRKKG